MAQTIFAYAQGLDLADVASTFETRFDALVAERKWVLKDVWVVNQRLPDPPAAAQEWDLGFNLTLPAKKPAKWTDDVVAIAEAFAALNKETGRKFVIGISDGKTDPRDLFTIEASNLDVDALRKALG